MPFEQKPGGSEGVIYANIQEKQRKYPFYQREQQLQRPWGRTSLRLSQNKWGRSRSSLLAGPVGPCRHHEVSGFSTGWTGAASAGGTRSDWHFQLLFDQHLNRPPSALKAHTPRSQGTLQSPLHRRGLDLRKIEWQMITSTDITEHVLNCS